MPIRFACLSCGQRLSANPARAGQTVACPKCQAPTIIPRDAPFVEDRARVMKGPLPTLSLTDEPATEPTAKRDTMVGGTTSVGEVNEEAFIDIERVAIPRYVVFVQGFLLAFVAISCFLLGLAVGRNATGPIAARVVKTPVKVKGTVSLKNAAGRLADVGSVVVFLPLEATPEKAESLMGLRPGDTKGREWLAREEFVRNLGGTIATCDDRGRFEATLPEQGKYFLLAISATAKPSPNLLSQRELGQISRFFDWSDDPLAGHRFQWRTEQVRSDTQISVDFD